MPTRLTNKKALHPVEQHFRAVFDRSPIGIIEVDRTGRYVRVNPAWAAMLGYEQDELTGRNIRDVTHAEDLEHTEECIAAVLSQGRGIAHLEKRFLHKDGSIVWGELSATALEGAHGETTVLAMVVNITVRKRAEDALRKERDRAQQYLDIAGVMFVALDAQGCITLINKRGCSILGYSEAELLGRYWFDYCLPPSLRDPVKSVFRQLMAGNIAPVEYYQSAVMTKTGEQRMIAFHNTVIRDEAGRIAGILCSGEDITERERALALLLEKQSRLNHLVHHDALTGLPNRLLFQDRLQQSIVKAKRAKGLVALLFLDLDRFKTVNDTLGHETGDCLLQAVADRLRGCVRESDTVARLGGDEFAILLAGITQPSAAANVATKVLDALKNPFSLERNEVHISASIGISLFPADGQDAEALLKHADSAMYLAKERGRGNYQFFA